MSPYLYHESMSVLEVWFYTMSVCLYHESLSNPCFNFYTIRNTVLRFTEIQITRIKKYKFHNYRNTSDFLSMGDLWIMIDFSNVGNLKIMVDFWIMVDF